jgi:hypothetical protein
MLAFGQRKSTDLTAGRLAVLPSAYTMSVSFGCQRFGQQPEDTIDPRPPTLALARLRACLVAPDFTDSDRPPIRPPTHLTCRLPQRLPPKRSIAHDFALVAACHRIVSQESVLWYWYKRHCAVRSSLRV